MKKILVVIGFLCFIKAVFANENYPDLSLEEAVRLATENDDWIKSSKLIESAYRDEATSHGALPDPTLSLGFANLPSDNFDFNQENMTQFKVGFTQRFPGGDSLEIKSRKSLLLAEANPHMRANRSAHLAMIVSHLWLDSFLALKSISLIESDRHLFQQLVEITTSRYQSAMGNARQQDVLRAQLELLRLEDRLTNLRMHYDINRRLLAEWLPLDNQFQPLFEELPQLVDMSKLSPVSIQRSIEKHPQLLISDTHIGVKQAEIDLAKEEYKPDWALNVSYGYREDSPAGLKRDDFLSLGVSFDLPLFTSNRQDKSLSAAYARKESKSIEYELLKKKMISQALKTLVEIQRLKQRTEIYETKILLQMHEQVESSLNAYTNDDGDFADVMRAYIAELNSKIEVLEIKVMQQKVAATMKYLMIGSQQDNQTSIEEKL